MATSEQEAQVEAVRNVGNLAEWVRDSGVVPGDTVEHDTSYRYSPVNGIHTLEPVNTGASMAFFPAYWLVTGLVGDDKLTEVYDVKHDSPDSARLKFMQRYVAAGARGITCHPLYDLNRFA